MKVQKGVRKRSTIKRQEILSLLTLIEDTYVIFSNLKNQL